MNNYPWIFHNLSALSGLSKLTCCKKWLLALDLWLSAEQLEDYLRLTGACFACHGRTDDQNFKHCLHPLLVFYTSVFICCRGNSCNDGWSRWRRVWSSNRENWKTREGTLRRRNRCLMRARGCRTSDVNWKIPSTYNGRFLFLSFVGIYTHCTLDGSLKA